MKKAIKVCMLGTALCMVLTYVNVLRLDCTDMSWLNLFAAALNLVVAGWCAALAWMLWQVGK